MPGVGGVERAGPVQGAAQLDQLRGPGEPGRHVGQAGGHPVRALVERLGQQPLLRPHLVRGELLGQPGRRDPQLAVPDQGRDVDRHAAIRERRGVAGQVGPVRLDRVVADPGQQIELIGPALRSERERGEPTVADHLGGHALVQLALGPAVQQHTDIGMGVHIDEARRDDQAARGQPVGAGDLRVRRQQRGNPTVLDQQVGGPAGAVR